jgi:hypothetical protein
MSRGHTPKAVDKPALDDDDYNEYITGLMEKHWLSWELMILS